MLSQHASYLRSFTPRTESNYRALPQTYILMINQTGTAKLANADPAEISVLSGAESAPLGQRLVMLLIELAILRKHHKCFNAPH